MKKKASKQSSRQNVLSSSSSKPSFDKHKLWMGIGLGLAVILVLVIIYVASSGKTLAGQATAAKCSFAGQVCTSSTQSNSLLSLVCETKVGRCVNNECPISMNSLIQARLTLSCVPPGKGLPTACVAAGNVCVEKVCFPRTQLTKVVEKCNGYTSYCTFKKGLTGELCNANEGLCVKSADCVAGTSCASTKMCVSATSCTPSTEICDQRDNDCDGKVDEDIACPKENQACTSTGFCSSGLICKSTDDHTIDQTVPDQKLCCPANKCNDGPGGNECVAEGTVNDLNNRICQSGEWVVPACIPSTEICDQQDNDCDSEVDEESACVSVRYNLPCTAAGQCADDRLQLPNGEEYDYNGYCHVSDESDASLCCPENWCNDGSAEGKCVAAGTQNDDQTKVCRVVDRIGVWRPIVGAVQQNGGQCERYSDFPTDSNCALGLFCKSVPPTDTDNEPNTLKCCLPNECNAHEASAQVVGCVADGISINTPEYKRYICQAGQWASNPQPLNSECDITADCGVGLTCKDPAPDSNGQKLCCSSNALCNWDGSENSDCDRDYTFTTNFICREGQWEQRGTGTVSKGGVCQETSDCKDDTDNLACESYIPGSDPVTYPKRCCPIEECTGSGIKYNVNATIYCQDGGANIFPAQPDPLYAKFWCEAGSWKARESWTCTQDSDCRTGLSCKDTIPGTNGQKRCCSATQCNKDPQTPSCTADQTQDNTAQYQCTAGSWEGAAPSTGTGDINSDSSVSDADVLALQYAILAQGNSNCGGASQETCSYGDTFACDDSVYDFESFMCEGTLPASADVNNDGVVTDADVLALQYAILAQSNSNCGGAGQQTCSYGDTYACDSGVYDFDSFTC